MKKGGGNNNQNNPKKIQAIKNRKSISPFASTSLSDPMNSLQNTGLKEKRINMINNFLIINNYPNNFNKKDFSNMSVDFRPILKFIMEKLDPNSNLLDSLTDDKIESLSKIYEYPGKLTRSMIRDFNTPSNFLYILTFICYMVNLCTYKEFFIEKEMNNIYYSNNSNISNSFNNSSEIGSENGLYEFLNDCINGSANNNVNQVYDKYKKKFNQLCSEELSKVDEVYAQFEKLEKENKELEKQLPNIDIIKNKEVEIAQKYNLVNEEYIKGNNEINLCNKKLNDLNNVISEQQKNLNLLDNEIKSTRNIIDTQIMSRAEYDIKQEENNNIENKIKIINNDINILNNTKNEIINTNQSLINKLTIIANDINNIDINNSKKIKTVHGNNIADNDISYILNMSHVTKEIKNNIINNKPEKNDELLSKYEEYITKYQKYINDIKEEYNNNQNSINELQKKKEIIKTEIEKYNNLLVNDNKIGTDRKDLIYKINNEYLKYKKDNNDYINIIKNDIKIYENNIEDKKQKSVEIEKEYNKLKKEFDGYKNETYNIINSLIDRYNSY
jgi:SMC interacting uncharacterized protein involved in chromosome segregation